MTVDTEAAAPAAAPDRPLRLRRVTTEGALTLIGAAAGALGLVWVLYERVLPFTGAIGFWLCWYGTFLVLYAAMAALQWDKLTVRDRVAAVALWTGGLLATAIVIDQVAYTLVRGFAVVRHVGFFRQDMANEGPLSAQTVGGVRHAIIGTLEQITLATIIAVPLGIMAAVFLAEVGGRMSRPVRTIVDAMTALPDIISGLFILAFAILTLGMPRSGLAASLALAVTMLPIVTRASEAVLRIVPGTLREASYALGGSQWRTVLNVVLPTARSGLSTAVVLAMARGIGETAPVLLTAGYSRVTNVDPLHNWQTSLPLYIFYEIQLPQNTEKVRAFGAGFALVIVVLILFFIARRLGGVAPGELTRRQRREIAREGARATAREGAPS
ncbi:MAG: phosphate ABC transporter permease PstA [Streptosporangiaceae bacterium]|nr:phosphate ABC transporter permease PstA [Streptosporangiaceae bacterium]